MLGLAGCPISTALRGMPSPFGRSSTFNLYCAHQPAMQIYACFDTCEQCHAGLHAIHGHLRVPAWVTSCGASSTNYICCVCILPHSMYSPSCCRIIILSSPLPGHTILATDTDDLRLCATLLASASIAPRTLLQGSNSGNRDARQQVAQQKSQVRMCRTCSSTEDTAI